jgi:hypothetical protein
VLIHALLLVLVLGDGETSLLGWSCPPAVMEQASRLQMTAFSGPQPCMSFINNDNVK